MGPFPRRCSRREPVNRRNTTKRPPPRTHAPLLAVIERLESRAMLAGLGQDSLSGLGSTTAVLLPGVSSPPGIVFNGGSPTLGSAAGTGGSQSNGPVLFGGSGSGTGSSSSGGSSSAPNGPVLLSGSGSGTGSTTSTTGSSPDPNSPVLFGGSGSGTGSSTSGSGSSTTNGPVLLGGSGSGTGSSSSGSGSSAPNGPVLSSQYTGGSNAGTQGTGTNNSGTLSGSDLWLLYNAGLGASSSSSGTSGGSSSNLLTLLTQYTEGSNADGQGNGTEGTLSNADLWRLYWSGAGAGSSSSGSDEGSLTNDPTISARYTGGSGIGLVFFVTGATGADAASSGSQQVSTGSTTLTLADGQSTTTITPLVYQPGSDDGPGVVSGVWTGGVGDVQFVLAADQDGDLVGQPLSIGKPGQPVLIVSGAGPNSQVVFDGSDLPPYTGPGIQSVARPRTLGEFLYDAFVADTVTVYGNTPHLAPNPRGYTVVGFFFANLVGVRGVSDAFLRSRCR